MRINEYNNLDEFISEFKGVRNPANNLWLGLEFFYQGNYYRFDTSDGKFYLKKIILISKDSYPDVEGYEIIAENTSMQEILDNVVIGNRKFRDVIMDDNTEILGKD